MKPDQTLHIRAPEDDLDALEAFLKSSSLPYERHELMLLSIDPEKASAIFVAVSVIHALAPILVTYLKERHRRVAISTPDGPKFSAEGYSADDVAKMLRAASEHQKPDHIELPDKTPKA